MSGGYFGATSGSFNNLSDSGGYKVRSFQFHVVPGRNQH